MSISPVRSKPSLAVVLLLNVIVAAAQTPDTVVAGPLGVPQLVKNEGGGWSEPIKVFSDSEEIVYVPDITTQGWARWHVKDFKEHGTYFTYVYTYLRKQRVTVQETIYVDTQARQVLVEPFLKPPVRYSLKTAPIKLVRITDSITELVRRDLAYFQATDIQTVMRQQRQAVGDLALCKDPLADPNPSCSSQNGVAGQRKETASASAPIILRQIDPQYPPEARAEKLGGEVIVALTIDKQGVPKDLKIRQSRGAALDKAALAAVAQYRFSPAYDATGAPVEMPASISIDFQIY